MTRILGSFIAAIMLTTLSASAGPQSGPGYYVLSSGLTSQLGTCGGGVAYNGATLAPQVCPVAYGSSHTVLATEMGDVLEATSSSSVQFTLPVLNTTGFQHGQTVCFVGEGTGGFTIVSSSTIVGPTSFGQYGNVCATADVTNSYWMLSGLAGGPFATLYILGSEFTSTSNTLHIGSGGVSASMIASGAAASNIGTLGGDLSGTLPNPTVSKFNGDSNVALLDAHQSFTKGQAPTPVALTYVSNGTTAVDFSAGNMFTVTLTGPTTQIGNPTNVLAGQCGEIFITQDATGGRLVTWSSSWKFSGGTKPTLSTGGSAVDVLSFCATGSSFIAVGAILANAS